MSFRELDPKTLELWRRPPGEWVDLTYHLDGFVPELYVKVSIEKLQADILKALFPEGADES